MSELRTTKRLKKSSTATIERQHHAYFYFSRACIAIIHLLKGYLMLEAKHAISNQRKIVFENVTISLGTHNDRKSIQTNKHIYTSWVYQETFLSDRFIK